MQTQNYLEGRFRSQWFSKFINHWLFLGVTYKIEKLFYLSFFLLKNKLNCCPLFFFFEALENIKPSVSLRFYKKKHKKKKLVKITAIPIFLTLSFQYRKAIFWLSKAIQLRHEKKIVSKILNELYTINVLNLGESLKKKTEYYKFSVMFKMVKRFKW